MSTLFISHSSSDNEASKDLQARLAEKGHRSVFLDLDPEAGIQAGVSWERTLYTKLRACRAVLALVSDNYLSSQWCFAEVALARMEGKELFVLQIDPWSEGTKMPSILTEEQFINVFRFGADYKRPGGSLRVEPLPSRAPRRVTRSPSGMRVVTSRRPSRPLTARGSVAISRAESSRRPPSSDSARAGSSASQPEREKGSASIRARTRLPVTTFA